MSRIMEWDEFESSVKISDYMEMNMYPDFCLWKLLWHVLSKNMLYLGRGWEIAKIYVFSPASSKTNK